MALGFLPWSKLHAVFSFCVGLGVALGVGEAAVMSNLGFFPNKEGFEVTIPRLGLGTVLVLGKGVSP
jgi:hypothetical protein